jgi:hypothetical protein
MLLDAESGDVSWDEHLDFGAYDVVGQLTSDVGLIWIRERDLEFVDLDNGDRAAAGRYEFDPTWKVIGDEMARFDGESLLVGADPFDSSASQFARLTNDGPEPFETLPETFVLGDFWSLGDGDAALVGYFDETPQQVEGGDYLPVATIELGEGLPVHEVPEATRSRVEAVGDYVYSTKDDQVDIYRGVELDPVTSIRIPQYARVTDLDHGIVIYDPEQSTITGYA